MKGRLAGAASFLFTAWVAVPDAHAQCTKDTDCKGDRICDHGECASPTPREPPAAATPPSQPPAVPAGTPEHAASPPAPPPQIDFDRSKVEVAFEPRNLNDTYGVDVAGIGHCTTPCTLRMSPGEYQLSATGAARFETTIVVPPSGASVQLSRVTRPLRRTESAIGLVMAGLGAISISVILLGGEAQNFPLPLFWGLLGGGLGVGLPGLALVYDSQPKGEDGAIVNPKRAPVVTKGPHLVGLGVRATARGTPVPALTFAFE